MAAIEDALCAELARREEELLEKNIECAKLRSEISSRDEMIARMKSAGDDLIQLANYNNKRAIEYVEVWNSLTKELEEDK